MAENKERNIQLEYPCAWIYKIIGVEQNEMKSAVSEIIRDRAYSITLSRQSQNAKYHCLNVEVVVESESHRQTIYESLKSHRAIKIIL
jgi:putative lipoic acid-binding regulatory protein